MLAGAGGVGAGVGIGIGVGVGDPGGRADDPPQPVHTMIAASIKLAREILLLKMGEPPKIHSGVVR